MGLQPTPTKKFASFWFCSLCITQDEIRGHVFERRRIRAYPVKDEGFDIEEKNTMIRLAENV